MEGKEVVAELIEDTLSSYRQIIYDGEGRPYPKRTLFREVIHLIDSKKPLVVIYGLRGVGKTFLLLQILDHYIRRGIRVLYLQVSDLYRRLQDPRGTFYSIFDYLGEKPHSISERTVLLLDEVQQVPGWDGWLKEIYEKSYFHGKLTVVATGSSSMALLMGSEVMRRAIVRQLYPLTFSEYLTLRSSRMGKEWSPPGSLVRDLRRWLRGDKGANLKDALRVLTKSVLESFNYGLEDLYTDYLVGGGFPVFLRSDTLPEYFEYLRGIVDKVIKDDLTLRRDLESSTLSFVDDILTFLADSVGSPVSLEKIGSRLGIPRSSVKKLIDGLVDTGLIVPLLSCGGSAKLREPRKYYFAHPDLMPAVLGLKSRRSVIHDLPKLLENAVFTVFSRSPYVDRICYVRGGADFLIDVGGRRLLVEVGTGKERTEQFRRSGVSYDAAILTALRGLVEENGVVRIPAYLLSFI